MSVVSIARRDFLIK